ncbi:hypothetical protein FHS18_000966 [Paenibacillus phyllosphaerae]|uniref:Dockerin domain-containing protein n=1 Tax=Paenibacillus phyllosphaerae TaxID=274593 RepID=A0A7W5FLD9_9BACL|nr:dockerin type I domain-containing protein [Paenibacillus phyllosphaerae]MBB3108914.1 hypothetical protein [Paenibacillus phyllosphaerae]
MGTESELAPAELAITIKPVTVTNPADVNQDGKVSVGDLAIVSFNYGKTEQDAGWAQIKFADVNNDGIIDLLDLAAVARKILG